MKKRMGIFVFVFILLAFNVFAAQINSTSYKQNVIISSGGDNLSSSSYKTSIAIDIINGIITSASYINKLGFFHTWLLADGQPCTSADQCEGGFCCSNLCNSSACPGGGGGGGVSGGGGGGGGGATPSSGGGGLLPVTEEKAKDFSISIISIKEHLALGASKTKTITIKNTGGKTLKFNLNVLTLNDFIFLSETSFSLEPGQEKNIEANIIGRKIGSYIGEIEITADEIKKIVDAIVEVESGQVLFDVKLDIPADYKKIQQGSDLKAQITLLNVGPPRKVDVIITYLIKDKLGRVLYESSETFAVANQTSFIKSFKLPEQLQPGEYLAIIEVRYENSFAVSSELFKIVPKTTIKTVVKSKLNIALMSALAVFVILMISFTYLIIQRIRKPRKRE